LIAGPDEKIYLGTWDGALILRFDPKQPEKGLEVVGKPSATEDYLWQFDLGKDNKLYACTYPSAKLVRFDTKTGAMEDLGRMHPTEMYARSLAVGANGKVYVGIGTEKGDLVVFDPATVRSTATYDEPRSYPVGIEQVIVAGTLVVADGAHTGATPGRGLRRGRD
jgi:outer membrane protein assembly factor BamB